MFVFMCVVVLRGNLLRCCGQIVDGVAWRYQENGNMFEAFANGIKSMRTRKSFKFKCSYVCQKLILMRIDLFLGFSCVIYCVFHFCNLFWECHLIMYNYFFSQLQLCNLLFSQWHDIFRTVF